MDDRALEKKEIYMGIKDLENLDKSKTQTHDTMGSSSGSSQRDRRPGTFHN